MRLSFFLKEITVNRPGSTCRVETATDLKNIKNETFLLMLT